MLRGKKKWLFALLSLVLLTGSSFSLAKYTQSNTYLLQINHHFDDAWYIGETIVMNTNYVNGEIAPSVPSKELQNGYYAIQIWGGSGGNADVDTPNSKGGAGGFVMGYIKYTKGDSLKIYVGAAGSKVTNAGGLSAAGFNGGLGGVSNNDPTKTSSPQYYGYGGGGATVVEFKDEVVLVAGGGGGAGSNFSFSSTIANGGAAGTTAGLSRTELENGVEIAGAQGGGKAPSGTIVGGVGGSAANPSNSKDVVKTIIEGVVNDNMYSGGGGGGGYYAGAAGYTFCHNGSDYVGSAGGGGASYVEADIDNQFWSISTQSQLYQDVYIGLKHITHTDRDGVAFLTYLGKYEGSNVYDDKTQSINEKNNS